MFASDLYIKSFNKKFIRVVFIACSDNDANHFIETNPCCGVIKEIGKLIFIAHNKDLGKTCDQL